MPNKVSILYLRCKIMDVDGRVVLWLWHVSILYLRCAANVAEKIYQDYKASFNSLFEMPQRGQEVQQVRPEDLFQFSI